MFIPGWIIWTIGIVLWLTISARLFFNPRGDFDFVTPLYGMMVFFVGIAFIVGILL